MQAMFKTYEDNFDQMSKSIFGTFQTTIVLHTSSTTAGYPTFLTDLTNYSMPEKDMDEAALAFRQRHLARRPTHSQRKLGQGFTISERNTPALFGVGKIDRIPAQLLHALARRQKKNGLVSGRVAVLREGVANLAGKVRQLRF